MRRLTRDVGEGRVVGSIGGWRLEVILRLLARADTAAVLAAGNTKAQKDELKIKGEPVPFFKDTRILY